MYELLGICVMLAALALLNACASLAVAVVWRLLAPLVHSFSARTRADLLFILRIAAPPFAPLAAALVLMPPSIRCDPQCTREAASRKLAAPATSSGATRAVAA